MGREPLRSKDLRHLLDAVYRLYAVQDHTAFTHSLVDLLASLVPVDIASYDELNPKTKKTFVRTAPHDYPMPSNGFEILGRFLLQHPCVAYAHRTGDGSPRKISDFIGKNQWTRTTLYNEFYRQLGTVHNLGMQMATGQDHATMVTMGFHRARRDFNERDRAILDILRPHLAQAYSNAQAVTEIHADVAQFKCLIEHVDQALIRLCPKGTVEWATTRAVQLLGGIQAHPSKGLLRLPDILTQWIEEQDRAIKNSGLLTVPLQTMDFVFHGKTIRARLLRQGTGRLLILEMLIGIIPASALAPLGLSRRESEILSWLVQGKSNADIATIVQISVRTVHKHVERIYQKLGVENRHAAMAAVYSFLKA